jgi:hypothetical protein
MDQAPAATEPAEPVVEATIEVEGELLAFPNMETLDISEENLLYEIAGIVLPDFMPAHPEAPADIRAAVDLAIAMRIRTPRFKQAAVAIAYRRAHPETPFDELVSISERVNAFDSELWLNGKDPAEEEAADPTPSSGA